MARPDASGTFRLLPVSTSLRRCHSSSCRFGRSASDVSLLWPRPEPAQSPCTHNICSLTAVRTETKAPPANRRPTIEPAIHLPDAMAMHYSVNRLSIPRYACSCQYCSQFRRLAPNRIVHLAVRRVAPHCNPQRCPTRSAAQSLLIVCCLATSRIRLVCCSIPLRGVGAATGADRSGVL